MVDIGQNDIAYGLRTVGDAQLLASIPDIIAQLVLAVQVKLLFNYLGLTKSFLYMMNLITNLYERVQLIFFNRNIELKLKF